MRAVLFVLGLSLVSPVHATTRDAFRQLDALLKSPAACPRGLARWTRALARTAVARGDEVAVMRQTFAARRALRQRLTARSAPSCVDQVRVTLSALRRVEDQAALDANQSPWLTADAGPVTLRSGDVLLSRGNAYVSAAIAKIGRVDGDFSHLAQVFIDAPVGTEIPLDRAATDPRVYTVEAHIEVGTFTRPFADYLADANARVQQLRPRQSAADAHHAARVIFDWTRAYQVAHAAAFHRATPTVDDNPPYDFKMNPDDAGAIFCAEVVSIAQAAVGRRVPRFPTTLERNQVTRLMGITRAQTFAPSDLEVDARFEVRAETRRLDKLASVMNKDAVMKELYARMARGEFEFDVNPADRAKALLAWIIRQNDLGFQNRLTKAMPTAIIALSFAIERQGAYFEGLLGRPAGPAAGR